MWLDRYTVMSKVLDFARTRIVLDERERTVLTELANQARKFHHVFSLNGVHIVDIPWQDDDNGGLPEWYFDNNWTHMTVDLTTDKVEWIPAVGPAPYWGTKYSQFATTDQLWDAFFKWNKATY